MNLLWEVRVTTPVRYIIATAPATSPPEGGKLSSTEPVRWYLEAKHRWTNHKNKALSFESPSEAVARIRDLRSRIMGIEFILEPLVGESMDVPASRGIQTGRREDERR